MGHTKLFIRLPKTLFETEDAFQAKKHELAAKIQAIYRRILQRRKYLRIRKGIITIQVSFIKRLAVFDSQVVIFEQIQGLDSPFSGAARCKEATLGRCYYAPVCQGIHLSKWNAERGQRQIFDVCTQSIPAPLE